MAVVPHEPDAPTKYAFAQYPRSWLALAGLPVPPTDAGVTPVDPTMSTVSMSADKLVRVDGAADGVRPYLAHVEFQTRRDVDFDHRMLRYTVWARHAYGLPVRSAAFLFHRRAAAAVVGGVSDHHDERSLLEFRYHLVPLWELPADRLLSGPIGTVPLAVLAATDDVPGVSDRAARRLLADLPRADARDMLSVAGTLLGVRLGAGRAEEIMGTFAELIEDSELYQTWVGRGEARGRSSGKVEAMQDVVLRLGQARLGPPPAGVVQRVRAAADLATLGTWTDRLLTADSWDAIVAD